MFHKLKYIVSIAILFASCSKSFLDINTDPNNPATVQPSIILPGVERTLGDALSLDETNGGLSEILEVYVHRMVTREEPDQYGITGTDVNLATVWAKLYSSTANPGLTAPIFGVLQNLDGMIKTATEEGNAKYAGIGKVLKAYTYSVLVDVFGDVPFSEANKLKEGIVYPKFDDDAAIYPQLFTMLDEAIADLTNEDALNILEPGEDDVIYGGDEALWVKAANTLKFKLYVQLRKIQDVSAEVTALVNSGELISETAESFLIPYGPVGATDDRNPGFGTYFASQRSNHVSPWFYEILKGYNQNILTNNPDPRLPYYIYNQVNATQASRDGNQTEYRDGPFVSIYFGSVGPDRDRTQQNTISLFGIYPVGGAFDDGSAEIATSSSGTGAAPYRMITYADVLYLQAELMQEGVIPGDAKAKLEEALVESFKQVDYVVKDLIGSSAPALSGTGAVNTYITKVLAEYTSTPAQQLEIIMTEKWISAVGSAIDSYNDIRRTGFPIVFDPNNTSMAPGDGCNLQLMAIL